MTHASAPPLAEFDAALSEFRRRWGLDGYHGSDARYRETYRVLSRHYRAGLVLDVGGWPGDFACVLSSLGISVSVIDKDPTRKTGKVRDAATGAYVLGGNTSLADKCAEYGIPVLQCDIERERFAYENASAAMVLCTEVISHLRHGLLHAMRECRRVLSPGGRFLVTTPHMASLTNRLSLLLGFSEYEGLALPYDVLAAEQHIGHSGMYRLFTRREVEDLLRRSGFDITEAGFWHLAPPASGLSAYAIRRCVIDMLSSRIPPFGNGLFVVAGVA